MSNKPPKASLFSQEHLNMKNAFGKPVVGWDEGNAPYTSFNPMGYGMMRIVVCDSNGKPMYDQPVIVENPGAVIICKMGDRIGLIETTRICGERIISNSGDYVRTINERNLWENLASSMGKTVWEAPKGLITSTAPEDVNSLILKTAKIESLQEAGFRIRNAKIVGRINTNSTFILHAQYAVFAEIESIGKSRPEDTELIGRAKLFTIEEIAKLQKDGSFEDSLTLGAMTLCGISLPFVP